jgi:hypothetical protein
MQFLNPYALWSAAVFLPLLLVLYFLKLRRTERVVSSTFLWKRSVQDLRVNSLFQALRRNILLLLQALVLVCLVFALAAPGCEASTAGGRSVIILIDCSAGMGATDVATEREPTLTRLDLLKREAAKLIRGLWTREESRRTGRSERPPDEAMILAFSDRTEIVQTFTRDINALLTALETVRVRHTGADFPAALKVLSGQAEARRNPPHIYIFTDGKVGRGGELGLRLDAKTDRLEIVTPPPIEGKSDDNVGITLFSVRRNAAAGGRLQAVAELVNCSAQERVIDLRLSLDGRPVPVNLKPVKVPPRRVKERTDPAADPTRKAAPEYEPGSASISFELPETVPVDGKIVRPAGVVRLEVARKDYFDLDDKAWDVIPVGRRPRGLLVTAGPVRPELSPVVAAVQAVDFADFKTVAREAFNLKMLEGDGESGGADMVIFDGFLPSERLPAGRYLIFGELPRLPGVTAKGRLGEPGVKLNFVETRHPLMEAARLELVSIFSAIDWDLPDNASLIAEGLAGTRAAPLIAEIIRDGSTYVVVGFNVNPRVGKVINTDWWVLPWFPVFIQNAVLYLGMAAGEDRKIEPGRPIDVPVGREVKTASVVDPAGKRHSITAVAGRLQYADTTRVGPYTVQPDGGPAMQFAVNLFNRDESDISPLPDGRIHIDHEAVSTRTALDEQHTDGWRWFLWAALAILMVEWYIYNRKVHI